MMKNFKDLTGEEIMGFMEEAGEPSFRAQQVIHWGYRRYCSSFEEMTDIPIYLRKRLQESFRLNILQLLKREVSQDGSKKLLFALHDGEKIESVLIPNGRGTGCYTICISSQVGCALGCRYCMTGRVGFRRNLTTGEIVDQIIVAKRFLDSEEGQVNPRITNIVFMGMGEPLLNLDAVIRAIRNITELMRYSRRRITVSTAGIAPTIEKIGTDGPWVNLAISLNATKDEVRNMLMPINRRYPIGELMRVCKSFPQTNYRRITFEYVMIKGINDSPDDVKRLVSLLSGFKSKINLIRYNPTGDNDRFDKPDEERVNLFREELKKAGISCTVRKSLGQDISAACGQLTAGYL